MAEDFIAVIPVKEGANAVVLVKADCGTGIITKYALYAFRPAR